MTLAAAARQSCISAQSTAAYEHHRKDAAHETLTSLAAALRFPLAFFSASPPVEMPPGAVSFRAPTKMSALERDSSLSVGSIAADLNNWLEQKFKLPKPNVPTYPNASPEEAAERLR